VCRWPGRPPRPRLRRLHPPLRQPPGRPGLASRGAVGARPGSRGGAGAPLHTPGDGLRVRRVRPWRRHSPFSVRRHGWHALLQRSGGAGAWGRADDGGDGVGA